MILYTHVQKVANTEFFFLKNLIKNTKYYKKKLYLRINSIVNAQFSSFCNISWNFSSFRHLHV